ncbi:MAG TPA: response regulator [Labilithrix sp.]|nr:response regulator [Labilithrix sp.]
MTVLLIDDSSSIRLQARRALEIAGFEVVEACDGLDAFEKLPAQKISLIVCDVNMPRMGGIEFIEKLAKAGGALPPILVLTTDGDPALVRRAKACGARGWMIKPFKVELLVAAARKITAVAA